MDPTLFIRANETTNIEDFMALAFPPHWRGIAARVLETGVVIQDGSINWAPTWSAIPMTKRAGHDIVITSLKSVMFKVHDCIHQLWGLPHPETFSEKEFYQYKRVQMCGEVAVLSLVEFEYAKWVQENFPELRYYLATRNALPMLNGPLQDKSRVQIAARLDSILHQRIANPPKWVRDSIVATAFAADYVPMLESDRAQVDVNWNLLKAAWEKDPTFFQNSPKASFGHNLDGLELTTWMIRDFELKLETSSEVDSALRAFNRKRRANIQLPAKWDS